MKKDELKRYERHSRTDFVKKSGQKKLLKSSIVIVGIGSLGSMCAQLSARAGIGHIHLIDGDQVELGNIQTQILYEEADIGKQKTRAAQKRLKQINSRIKIGAHPVFLQKKNLNLLEKADLVLDCSDNLETRFLINDYCIKNKQIWVHGSAVKDIGRVIKFIPGKPCFRCIFDKKKSETTWRTSGVLNTITSIVGAIQVNEAINLLLKKSFSNDMIFINVKKPSIEKVKITKRKSCTC